jgi:hypothetical protein
MFYEDLFDIEDEYNSRLPGRYDPPMGSLYEVKKEKRFYKLYSAFMNCHAIIKDGRICEHTLNDIKSMSPSEKILEISYNDKTHFFDVESLMNAETRKHSLVLKDTKNKSVVITPTQLRSMITDGTIDLGN